MFLEAKECYVYVSQQDICRTNPQPYLMWSWCSTRKLHFYLHHNNQHFYLPEVWRILVHLSNATNFSVNDVTVSILEVWWQFWNRWSYLNLSSFYLSMFSWTINIIELEKSKFTISNFHAVSIRSYFLLFLLLLLVFLHFLLLLLLSASRIFMD